MSNGEISCPVPSCEGKRAEVFLYAESGQEVASSWGVSTGSLTLFRCPSCGIRFRTPPPPEVINQYYAAEYHDSIIGKEIDSRRLAARKHEWTVRTKFLKRFCPLGKVMDVGCSTGLFASELLACGYDAFGSDISEYACQEAATLIGQDRVFHGTIQQLALDLPPGSFDAITLMDVIEHFDNVVDPLASIFTLLKPGGAVFIRTPSLSSPFFRIADTSYFLTAGRYTKAVQLAYHAEHLFFFSEKGMRALLHDIGFQVISLDADPLSWLSFSVGELHHGIIVNGALASVYWVARLLGRGHGMRIIARKPTDKS